MSKKVGVQGENMIANAVDEARLEQERERDSKDERVLVIVHALVEEFIGDRRRSIDAGELTEIPPQILEDHAWLERHLDEQPPAETVIAEEPEPEIGSRAISKPPIVTKEQPPVAVESAPPPTAKPTHRERRPSPIAIGWMVTGAGLASIAGGGVLIGYGAHYSGKLAESEARFQASGMTPGDVTVRDGFRDAWEPDTKSVLIIGPILVAAGVGLTTWGARSLQRHRHPKRYATTLAPRVSPREASLNLSLTF